MTDKNDEYYQPWVQGKPVGNEAPLHSDDAAAPHTQGAMHSQGGPQDPNLPPMGMDLARYADQEKGVRPPLLDAAKVKQGTATALTKLRAASLRFADWTIALGQKADIPTRVEKMEIPRRTKDLARRSGAAAAEATRTAAEATRTAAEGTAKASKASAAKSKEIWEKMALADKVGNIASEAGRGLTDMADKTKQSLGQVARAGKETLEDTAEKLRPQRSEEEAPTPPLSGLEQLLAREEQEERKAADAKSTAELPLFSEDQPRPAAMIEELGSADSLDGHSSSEDGDNIAAPEPATTSAADVQPIAAVKDAAAPVPVPAPPSVPAPQSMVPPPTAPVPSAAASETAPHISPSAATAATPTPAPAPMAAPPPSPAPAMAPSFFDETMTQNHAPPSGASTPDARPVPNYEVVNRAPAAPTSAAPMSAAYAPALPAFSARTWALGGAALIALLGSSYWLGSRFGGGMSKADVETIVADYITTNPQIIPAALEAQRDREIAKAIDAVRPALEKPYAGAWGGNADGDVTLVVFTDYACGFCRASVPDIDRLLREDKRLKVVYRELPIISRESRSAALMALAAARQGKYDAFHHAMFAQSSLAPSAIIKAAEQAGVSLDGSGDATADEALFQRELESNLALGNQLQLNATPTWVIGDQLMQGQVGFDALRDAIARTRTKQAS
ncbi:DsbA family protein [Sphingopyxis yananensis]|uniref:DsbA family protein n=1 Tax=Sphingopyxis yananensis TaxID=2886687 RepID=UPI001D1162AA|nr:thioredoxin domain-containing protein [Sphingopyxis yananensis]MCC2601191.1 thioredoxin domain-containing protein [Sphingopyxis yananensis]